MTRLHENHEFLNNFDWNSLFEYSEESFTCLKWKNPFRVGNKGTPTPRKSLVVGGISKDNHLKILFNKKYYSIPKIIWVMHNGPIPEGLTVWFKDNNRTNSKIDNLFISEVNYKPINKYCESIKNFIVYDETSPSCLRWTGRSSKSSNITLGGVAGYLDDLDKYWKIKALGHSYKAHRLIWFMFNGEIPKGYHIDHIDRNRQNNKIENLRAVPPSINGKNRSKNRNNKTGVNNISYGEFLNHRGTLIRRYVVEICYNGKNLRKSYSITKYGEKLAWELALKTKQEFIKKLKEMNIGFTEDHGT